MNSELIHKLNQITAQNLADENFGPEQLAEKMGMSHSTLHRKLKEFSGQTISQLIREVRLKKAKEILLNKNITVSEIAYKVGFGSASYFNKCFHEYFGAAPGEYKKQEQEKKPRFSKSKWKTQKVLLVVVAPVLILLLLFLNEKYSFLFSKTAVVKSIAIKPFSFSGNLEKEYVATPMMIEIVSKLSLIKNLRVMSSTSIQPDTKETNKQIGKRLAIDYLLEGNLHLEDDKMILTLNLINLPNETVEWTKSYHEDLTGIYNTLNAVSLAVSKQLDAVITPEEKQRIEKNPTVSLTAYDFYQRGRNEYQKYPLDNENKAALERAEKYYNTALEYDPSFALAYVGLAQIYRDKNYWEEFFKETFLDSVMILSEKALSLDNQLAEAHNLKGLYFVSKGNINEAMKQYDQAIKINPNLWEAYLNKGKIYLFDAEEIDQAIFNLSYAAKLHRGNFLPNIFYYIGLAYQWIGLFEKSSNYYQEAFKLNGDSLLLYTNSGDSERMNGSLNKAAEWYLKAYQYDSTNLYNLVMLGFVLSEEKKYCESLNYYQKLWNRLDSLEIRNLNSIHRIGYAYFQNGYTEKANYYFNLQKQYCEDQIKLNRENVKFKFVYYDLAAVYAFKGEKEKALENLRIFNERKTMPFWAVGLIKTDPLFENIRNEPEFQQIVKDVDAKYQAEHERVKKWLEEQGML